MRDDDGQQHEPEAKRGGELLRSLRNLLVDPTTLALAFFLWLCSLIVIGFVFYVWLGLGTTVTIIVAAVVLVALLIVCLRLTFTPTEPRP